MTEERVLELLTLGFWLFLLVLGSSVWTGNYWWVRWA